VVWYPKCNPELMLTGSLRSAFCQGSRLFDWLCRGRQLRGGATCRAQYNDVPAGRGKSHPKPLVLQLRPNQRHRCNAVGMILGICRTQIRMTQR
jgi:hypothetical protein